MLSYIQKHLQLTIRTIVDWKRVLQMKREYKSVNINVWLPPLKKVKRNPYIQPHLIMLGLVSHKLSRHDSKL